MGAQAEQMVRDKIATAGSLPLDGSGAEPEMLPQWTLLVHWQVVVELSACWEAGGGRGVARRLARVRRRHRAGAIQRARDRRRGYVEGLHPVWLDTLAMTRAQMLVIARAVGIEADLTRDFETHPLPARRADGARIEAGVKQVLTHQEQALLVLATNVDRALERLRGAPGLARLRLG